MKLNFSHSLFAGGLLLGYHCTDTQTPPPTIRGIAFELLQSFENILFNSYDALVDISKGNICIQTIINHDNVQIIFIDNGNGINLPGIENSSFKKLDAGTLLQNDFTDIYYVPTNKFKNGLTTKEAGTGFGMSRLLYYIKNNNGDIEIFTSHAGTMIVLSFPYYKDGSEGEIYEK